MEDHTDRGLETARAGRGKPQPSDGLSPSEGKLTSPAEPHAPGDLEVSGLFQRNAENKRFSWKPLISHSISLFPWSACNATRDLCHQAGQSIVAGKRQHILVFRMHPA